MAVGRPDRHRVPRRDALGGPEVNRRFLRVCGLSALCVDTGYAPTALLSPAETADFAGATAFEVVRLEQVAELYLEVVGMDAGHVIAAIAGNEAVQ